MRLFSSITPIQIDEKKLSNDDLFEVCKYTQWSAISDKIAERLRNFRSKDNKTCLHIAAEYDNKNLVIGLVRNRINDPNSLSAQHENPLMLALRNNRLPKSDKIIMFLSSKAFLDLEHTNLKEKDMDDKYAFEI
jgi:ankyrin repeat protein